MKVYKSIYKKNWITIKLNEDDKKYIVDIIPLTNGKFIAYDPIAKSRIYKKGTISPIQFNTEEEAFERAVKILNKKYGVKKWYSSLNEDLRLSDFQKHAGISNFTKKFKNERQKIKGSANISARIVRLLVNTKKDYVTFVFYSAPTYDFTAKTTNPKNNFKIGGEHPFYTQQIKILDFFKWAKTTPGYKSAKELSIKDLKDILKVASIQVFCDDPSYHWQGDNWIISQFDASIYPTDIPPKYWRKYHNDNNFICKHLSMLLVQINFWLSPMASMLSKYLKEKT